MARDYAQRSNGNRRQTRSTRSGGGGSVPGWVWMIAGLSFGLAVAAFVYIKRPVDGSMIPQARESTGAEAQLETGNSAKATPRKGNGKQQTLALPPKEKERFTFYSILKDQEVVLPGDAAKSAQPPGPSPKPADAAASAAAGNPQAPTTTAPTASNAGSYIIQVASYRSQTEAEKQKASLALIGVESRVESVTIDGKDTFYRVRIGPDRNWPHVQATMARLESNGIQALLVKLQ
ncbi:MAG: SPOR domain-containing protein [Solimonas sp.]